MGLEIALLVSGVLLFAAIAFYSLRGQQDLRRTPQLGAEPTIESQSAAEPADTPSQQDVVLRERKKEEAGADSQREAAPTTREPEAPAEPSEPTLKTAQPVAEKPASGPESVEIEEPRAVRAPTPRPESEARNAGVAPTAAPVEQPKPAKTVESKVSDPQGGSRQQPASRSVSKGIKSEDSDLEIDFVARIKIGRPVIRDEILGIYRQHEYQFEKPSKIFGRNELTGLWCDIELELDSAAFTQVGASIQLADKNGAITEDELNRFSQMMLTMADTLNRPFRFSMEFEEALERANHLDQLGQRYDAMAVLNISARQKNGFRATDLESCARDLNMYKNPNGVYICADTRTPGGSQALYRMAPADEKGQLVGERATDANVRDLVLYMNVPATRDPEQVFHRMMEDARSLAEWLDGKIIDQHGRHMTARGFKQITRQIRDISQDMKKDGLRPGDTVSSRLF